MSTRKATAGPFKRHKTRHRGITYRVKADGSRTYYVFAAGKQVAIEGGEKEALAKQAELRGKLNRGELLASRPVKFGDVAEEWLESKRKLRAWTRKGYRSALDNVLLPRFGKRKLARIRPDDIIDLVQELEAKGLSRNYIDNLLKPLGGTFKYAMKKGLVGQNPLALLGEDDRPERSQRERREWSPEDVRLLGEASRELASRATARYDYSLLLETAIRTGLRLGELLGLQWGDLDLDQGMLHVRMQWTRTRELAPPKTKQALRRVPLAPGLVKLLVEHKLGSSFSLEDDPVFASSSGTPLSHRNVQRRGFEPAAQVAGLTAEGQPRVSFHDLRHAFASIMIERGVSPTVLANLMGHTSAVTTERIYVHLFNRQRSDDEVRVAMQEAMAL